jgi:hypothetical protein
VDGQSLFFGAQIVADVRAAVFAELGYTCSGGVAHNRKFAKLIAYDAPRQLLFERCYLFLE